MARSSMIGDGAGPSGRDSTRSMRDWTDRSPDLTYDLHGQSVLEAAATTEQFLRTQARARPGAVVRLITGRGRGGGGAPLRTRVRTLLNRLRGQQSLVRDFMLEESQGSFLVRLTGRRGDCS
jgi:DNA-nicking Smr family endonuclease